MCSLLEHLTEFQEPGPAKVAVTGSGIPDAEKVPDSRSIIWQEELQSREADVAQVWPSADIPTLGSPLPLTGMEEMAPLLDLFLITSIRRLSNTTRTKKNWHDFD